MLNDKISVIVPVYNVENYLDECVTSIVNQTYEILEIILVDDGSTDSSGRKCDEWGLKDNRIVVIHKQNGGLSDARNRGLEIATGEYVAFVDSDDFIDIKMYETMLETMKHTNADLVSCGRYIYNGRVIGEKHFSTEVVSYSPEEALSEMLQGGIIEEAAWDKLFRRSLLKDIRFPVGEINEDIVVMPTIFSSCKVITHCGKSFYYYRRNTSGITKSGYKKTKNVVFTHIDSTIEWVNNYFPNLSKPANVFEARYAYTTLLGLSINDNDKKMYRAEYKEYMRRLRKSWFFFINSGKVRLKDKLVSGLVLLNVYGFMWKAKKRLKK